MSRVQIPTPEEQNELRQSAAEVRRSLNFSTYYLRNPAPSTMPTIDTGIAQRFCSEELGSITWPCLLAIMVVALDWYRYGFSIHVGIVAIGIIASMVILLLLSIHCLKVIQVRLCPSVASMFFYTTMSFVPYWFALYLVLFIGLYSVLVQFSFFQLVQSLLFIVAGHCIAGKVRRLQEFHSCVYEELK